MDTISIIDYIQPHQLKNMFKGVYACDNLPKNFTLPAIFVVNLSKQSECGTHWIGIYINIKRDAFYFDSFGIDIRNSYIKRFLEKHAKNIYCNRKQIQHITSIKCGKFCCVFAVAILNGCSVENFLSKFNINLFVNDFTIENMFAFFKK